MLVWSSTLDVYSWRSLHRRSTNSYLTPSAWPILDDGLLEILEHVFRWVAYGPILNLVRAYGMMAKPSSGLHSFV